MSQQNPLELAKQGNPNAIAALINRNLQPKGIIVKVSKKGDCLRIMLEADEVPEQSNMVKFIHNGIAKLAITNIVKPQVFGRQIGDEVPAWSQTINLVTQQIQEHEKQQSSLKLKQEISRITTPEYVPTNRGCAIILGVLGFLGSLMFLVIPIIGWIIGIFGIIGSLGLLANGLSGKGLLKGICPYCDTDASVMEDQAGFDCKGCKKKILVKDKIKSFVKSSSLIEDYGSIAYVIVRIVLRLLNRVIRQNSDITYIALKINEYRRGSESANSRIAAYFDGAVHLVAGQNNIPVKYKLYRQIGTKREQVLQFAEDKVGKTQSNWNQPFADSVAVGWSVISEVN